LHRSIQRPVSIDKIQNVFFKKDNALTFSDVSSESGLVNKTVSCGAAYGDLDNDGDLDIVVNNIGEPSNIIENRINDSNNYLRIKLLNENGTIAEGAKAYFRCGDNLQSRELLTTRGYQSSSEPIIHFGVSSICDNNELQIVWPSGKTKSFKEVQLNSVLELREESSYADFKIENAKTLLEKITAVNSGVDFKQRENDDFDDYKHQVLLPHKMSEQGPFISKADITGDGLEDFFIGAPTGQAAEIYIQEKSGKFNKLETNIFEKDKKIEDGGSAFADIDGDNDMDLIVVSGGYEFDHGTKSHLTRVYLNDGNSNFKRAVNSTLDHDYASSCVRPFDYDNDGDIDIFIGGLLEPKKYPLPGHSALFVNNGKGKFQKLENANFEKTGMVKDAQWIDLNGDEKKDLIIVGEWMPISFWIAEGENFVDKTSNFIDPNLVGWWNCIKKVDLDNNGLEDLIIGNLGLNYKYKASAEKPFKIYSNDVDDSGTYDIMLSTFYDDIEYPVRGKTCSAEQIPSLNSKFKTFEEFSKSDMTALYGSDLNASKTYSATEFRSVILYQDSTFNFNLEYLPIECQKAPINSIEVLDINGDKKQDLILAGNLYQSEIETGRADFGTGQILLNNGRNNWGSLKVYESGLYVPGDVKSTALINADIKSKTRLIIGNNNDDCEVFEFIY
jgi:hypothetical protein